MKVQTKVKKGCRYFQIGKGTTVDVLSVQPAKDEPSSCIIELGVDGRLVRFWLRYRLHLKTKQVLRMHKGDPTQFIEIINPWHGTENVPQFQSPAINS